MSSDLSGIVVVLEFVELEVVFEYYWFFIYLYNYIGK